jgi:hypothetical protein
VAEREHLRQTALTACLAGQLTAGFCKTAVFGDIWQRGAKRRSRSGRSPCPEALTSEALVTAAGDPEREPPARSRADLRSVGDVNPVYDRPRRKKGRPRGRPAALSQSHAAPPPWMPPESNAANHRYCRCDDNRSCRCDDNRSGRYDDDRASIGTARSPRSAVKARTATTFGTGAVKRQEREQNRGRRDGQQFRVHYTTLCLDVRFAPFSVASAGRLVQIQKSADRSAAP